MIRNIKRIEVYSRELKPADVDNIQKTISNEFSKDYDISVIKEPNTQIIPYSGHALIPIPNIQSFNMYIVFSKKNASTHSKFLKYGDLEKAADILRVYRAIVSEYRDFSLEDNDFFGLVLRRYFDEIPMYVSDATDEDRRRIKEGKFYISHVFESIPGKKDISDFYDYVNENWCEVEDIDGLKHGKAFYMMLVGKYFEDLSSFDFFDLLEPSISYWSGKNASRKSKVRIVYLSREGDLLFRTPRFNIL